MVRVGAATDTTFADTSSDLFSTDNGECFASFAQYLVECRILSPRLLPKLNQAMRDTASSSLDVAYSSGLIKESMLFSALAKYHDLHFLDNEADVLKVDVDRVEVESCLRHLWVRCRDQSGRTFVAAAPLDPTSRLLRHLGVPGAGGHRVIDVIATPSTIRALIDREFSQWFSEKAVGDLARSAPEFSARRRLAPWQAAVMAVVFVSTIAGIALAPQSTFVVVGIVFGCFFFVTSLVRLVCFVAAFLGRRPKPLVDIRGPGPDRELPVYTILVPLYREAAIVRQIIRALLEFDYPSTHLDIKIVLEEDDSETLEVVKRLDLPGCVEVVVVPPKSPQTKPKAMNYALMRARGSLVAVYDAEDIPHPGQLRRAAAAFADAPEHLACFQTRLGFYNAKKNWLTKQLAIEYATLFEAVIPALDRLNLPIMLGGTSNHFRLSALVNAGAWDAYNVTEDADLGIRFARLGYKCGWLDCLTLEEAASTAGNWFEQRQRWLRGFIQTYFVHMQRPARLLGDLGLWRFIVFQALVGGIVLSSIIYPLFLVQFLWQGSMGRLFLTQEDTVAGSILLLNSVNMLFGFGVTVELALVGLYRSRCEGLKRQLPWLLFYWLFVSLASYGAVLRFFTRPFEWEKTPHQPLPPNVYR